MWLLFVAGTIVAFFFIAVSRALMGVRSERARAEIRPLEKLYLSKKGKMKANTGFSLWNGAQVDRYEWVDALSTRGWRCRLDASHFDRSTMDIERAGRIDISNMDIAWQVVSPSIHHPGVAWSEKYLIVKLVKTGALLIEQCGQTTKIGPGDLAVVDPEHMFTESIGEPTRLCALRIPKSAFRERGLSHNFPLLLRPNLSLTDVRVVRDFFHYLASQAGKASEGVLARLGDQCLDLLDVLINSCNESTTGRSRTAIVLRARQLIARHLGDADLSCERIAAELSMSASSLSRALQASGLSVMRYVWSRRLEQAAFRLLGEVSHGGIKRIAYECGFTNHAHFSRAFKARYGMTPRDYAAIHEIARRAKT